MAASLRDLRRKIKSITGTQKITSAMQLVAASKMQRATQRAIEARPYAKLAEELVNFVAPTVDPATQPLFARREAKNVLVLLVTTNRALAGALNTQLFRVFSTWQKEEGGRTVKVVAVGAKGRNYLVRFAKDQLTADFPAPEALPEFSDATPIAKMLIDEFLEGRADRVYVAYNHFVSTLRQEPRIVPYLPFAAVTKGQEEGVKSTEKVSEIIFEPSREQVLASLIPRYLRVRLYQILLEAYASEQSARMIAMKNATDNAGDLIDDLSLTYNGLRQASITAELLDIAGGAAALET